MIVESPEIQNRRCADRFAPTAGYSRVVIRPEGSSQTELKPEQMKFAVADGHGELEGHAYDISLNGLRFELDTPLHEGDQIGVELHLPGLNHSIKSTARVVRVFDEDGDPGPRRMAATFKSFDSPSDATRLSRHLGIGYFGRER